MSLVPFNMDQVADVLHKGGCEHKENATVKVILTWDTISLLPVMCCKPCASRLWEQCRESYAKGEPMKCDMVENE